LKIVAETKAKEEQLMIADEKRQGNYKITVRLSLSL
jgi:hypothetical protein